MTMARGHPWRFIALFDEFQRRSLVTRGGDEGFQHLALVIDGAPQVAHLAVDFHVDLVEMPTPRGVGAHVLNAPPADLGGKHRTEPVPPEPRRLVADVDAALEQQVLDVTQGQRVAQVHHDHQADHLRRVVEPAERIVDLF